MRLDHEIIVGLIRPGSRVLDLGCGDGTLHALLEKNNKTRGQGVELSETCVYHCVEKGVSVFHSNIENGLQGYPDQSFDYVILNQSLQEVKNIGLVLNESLRVGAKAIVGIPNFAYWDARFRLLFSGKAPVTPSLPYNWSDTPNVRFMSLMDFKIFCREHEIEIEKTLPLGVHHRISFWPNLFAQNGLFLLKSIHS
ncbi:methionine biosynthesis protein MetW [candidate division KSB1 bacterium]|nr:methionine biosynthesis protein MetW [candidate division KSB1 bacterium]